MIDFLTRFNNLQSYLILKMFDVMIIPMVNPDGVFDGNYRMDLNNTNLNRVYQ
jgi:murein tripeptide amidase MpaA